MTRSAEWLYLGSDGRGGLCGSSWVTKDEFYAGLAAAQAMPGPLFNFAAYLGERSALLLHVWQSLRRAMSSAQARRPSVGVMKDSWQDT